MGLLLNLWQTKGKYGILGQYSENLLLGPVLGIKWIMQSEIIGGLWIRDCVYVCMYMFDSLFSVLMLLLLWARKSLTIMFNILRI